MLNVRVTLAKTTVFAILTLRFQAAAHTPEHVEDADTEVAYPIRIYRREEDADTDISYPIRIYKREEDADADVLYPIRIYKSK